MNDPTDYSKPVRKIIADDEQFEYAVDNMVTLHGKEFISAMRKLLMNPYVGAADLGRLMSNEFQLIIGEDEDTEILAEEQLPLTLVE